MLLLQIVAITAYVMIIFGFMKAKGVVIYIENGTNSRQEVNISTYFVLQ